MTRPELTTSRAARAAFFLFAAALALGLALGATPVEASLPRSADATALNVAVPDAAALDGEASATILRGAVAADLDDEALKHVLDVAPRLGFAEDLCLLEPDHGQAGFAIFGRETCRCERTYARNNPLKYVDRDGRQAAPFVVLNPVVATASLLGTALYYGMVQYVRHGGPLSSTQLPRARSAYDAAIDAHLSQSVAWPGWDPAIAPGSDWEWRGKGVPGSRQGAWTKPGTGESLHPDLEHGEPVGPHWDYVDADGNHWRIHPDGTKEPKGKQKEKSPAKPEPGTPEEEAPSPEDDPKKLERWMLEW